MSNLTDALLFIPAVTLLLYTPLVCYLDWAERKVDHEWWIPLVVINAPLFMLLLLLGIYQWWMPVISLVAIVLAFAAMKLHYIEGADFLFIMFIVLFLQYNPVSGRLLMALSFFIFLVAMLIVTAYIVMLENMLLDRGLSFGLPHGIPLMFPISTALWLTILFA